MPRKPRPIRYRWNPATQLIEVFDTNIHGGAWSYSALNNNERIRDKREYLYTIHATIVGVEIVPFEDSSNI